MLVVCFISLYAHAEEFYPYCSGDDGVSYVQGYTKHAGNGTPYIYLEGYGRYKNATVQVIVYSKNSNLEDVEWYRDVVTIKNGEGNKSLTTLNKVSKVEIRVADFCK